MNILYINNYNYPRGGAENIFLSEFVLAKNNGHCPYIFTRKFPKNLPSANDSFFPGEVLTDNISFSVNGFKSLLNIFYSPISKKKLRDFLRFFPIDIAHIHNIYGRLTTSVLDCLNEFRIPTVMTLHDYKTICPNYKMMHHEKICEDCKPHRYFQAILNKCHKDSYIASAIYSLETYFNYYFKKYLKNINFFISPSKFLKTKLIDYDFPSDRIVYIPNFIALSEFKPNYSPGDYFLYIGRLSSEKGIVNLINAFKSIDKHSVKLKIVGEGPLEHELKQISGSDARIEFMGHLCGSNLSDITRNSLAVVVPSQWYENAPLSILESMAYGKPVIGSNIGGIPEMIESGNTGFLFDYNDASELTDLLRKVSEMKNDRISDMGHSARLKVENEYSDSIHLRNLNKIYHQVILAGAI